MIRSFGQPGTWQIIAVYGIQTEFGRYVLSTRDTECCHSNDSFMPITSGRKIFGRVQVHQIQVRQSQVGSTVSVWVEALLHRIASNRQVERFIR